MLTNATVKAARCGARPYKLADQRGLHLLVAPTGRKSFRMKFRLGGREQLLTLGQFPDLSLVDARAQCDAAREQLRRGVDPRGRANLHDETFEAAARAWHAHQRPRWTPVHAADVIASLERDVFPAIGTVLLANIDPPAVLKLLRKVEARGCLETARRLRQRISAIFALTMSEGRARENPAALVGPALMPTPQARHHPALLELEDIRSLLAAVELVKGARIAKLASHFLALTGVRLAAVLGARWGEFEEVDWAGGFVGPLRPLWRVPATRVKLRAAKKLSAKNDHLVPLSREAVDVLREVRQLCGDRFAAGGKAIGLVFFGRDFDRPIGEGAIGALYDATEFCGRHVPHGWRASFSTLLNRRYRADRIEIDRALGHATKDKDVEFSIKVEAAYNRDEDLARRRFLFQRWADLLKV